MVQPAAQADHRAMQPEQPDQPSEGSPPSDEPAPGGGGWVPPFQILRSRHDRKLGGVAGGLAAATNLDPTVVRLAIVLSCLTGWAILGYLIAWAVIPEEDPAKGRYLMPAPEPTGKHMRIGLLVLSGLGVLHVLGAILGVVSSALIGLGLFPAHLFGLTDNDGFEVGEAMLGLVLLIGGLLLVFRRHLPWAPAPDTGSGPGGGPWLGGRGSDPGPASGGPATPSTMALATITPGSGGAGATAGGYYGPPLPPSGATGPAGFGARASAAAQAARTNGPLLLVRATGWLVGLWFLAAAIIAGVFWLTGALDVRLPVLPIVTSLAAVGALGYTLVRTRRPGAVIGAMALLLVPAGLAAALVRVDGQAGDRSVTPIVAADLEREYRHAVGALDLDLSQLQLAAGSRTPIDISMGAGRIEVIVPWNAEVEARASVGAGSFDLFGNRQTGVNLKGRSRSTALASQAGAAVLDIRGKAGAGEVIVRRGFEPITQQALRSGEPVPMHCGQRLMHPKLTHPKLYGATSGGNVWCVTTDGVTTTPPLACVVSAYGDALCRPVGEPEPEADFADDPGTRRCQVPVGGGASTCTAPISDPAAPGGSFTCTIPAGGGPAVCSPTDESDPADPAGPESPTPPAAPAAPTDPNASSTTTATTGAAPGEYRCTVPEGGGPATCVPA